MEKKENVKVNLNSALFDNTFPRNVFFWQNNCEMIFALLQW